MGRTILEDAKTGERYELIDLPPQTGWLFAPHLLYECGACRTRFKAHQPPGLCAACRATLSQRRS